MGAHEMFVAQVEQFELGAIFDAEGLGPGRRIRGLALHQRGEVELACKVGLRHRGEQAREAPAVTVTEAVAVL